MHIIEKRKFQLTALTTDLWFHSNWWIFPPHETHLEYSTAHRLHENGNWKSLVCSPQPLTYLDVTIEYFRNTFRRSVHSRNGTSMNIESRSIRLMKDIFWKTSFQKPGCYEQVSSLLTLWVIICSYKYLLNLPTFWNFQPQLYSFKSCHH